MMSGGPGQPAAARDERVQDGGSTSERPYAADDVSGWLAKLVYSVVWPDTVRQDVDDALRGANLSSGVPTRQAAALFSQSQSWEQTIRLGMCQPIYVLNAANSQLNNLTVTTVLLAGFALSFVVGVPEFTDEHGEVVPKDDPWFQAYGASMALSGLACLISTLVTSTALGVMNNVLPTRSAMIFLSGFVFKTARAIAEVCIIASIGFLLVGLAAALRLNFGPAAGAIAVTASLVAFGLFLVCFVSFQIFMFAADQLVAADIATAAATETPVVAGLAY